MILGINPKNDYAFKSVFGSSHHTGILIHLLNGVLANRPESCIVSVELLNPITERVVLSDKELVLDIRARDQSGCQFNIEMQMVPHSTLPGRLLYYLTKLYSGQLKSGDPYDLLQPVVSICFVDGLVFPQTSEYHFCFGLWERRLQRLFSDHLRIHLFQLPSFTKTVEQVSDPLDLWLYFLNNGEWLDPENLPGPLQVAELEEAMDVLKKLSQDEYERELYESREKARRDILTWEKSLEQAKQQVEQAKQQVEQAKQQVEQANQQVEQANQQVEQANQQVEQANQQAQQAEQQAVENLAKGRLIGRIRLCEGMLRCQPLSQEQLEAMSVDELQQMADQLHGQLPA